MSDLISRKSVLALAKDVTLEGGAKHRCIDASQIHELPSAQQWIPCSERLPNTSGTYIVTRWFCKGESDERLLPDACYFDGTDTWYDDNRINHSRSYVTDTIVAWMPLPESYRKRGARMTRELAIQIIQGDTLGTPEQTAEAVRMAIEALSQPPSDDWEQYSDRLWKEAYERGKADAQKQGKWVKDDTCERRTE